MAEPVRAAAVVPWERLVDFTARVYEAAGLPPEQALDAAESLVDADGHGTTTHGLKNLRMYIANLREGRANATPNIRQVGGSKASAVLSADGALGHVAAYAGVRKAIELAREYSVGTVIVRDSNHYGHSGFWATVPVRHNMIGFAFTNAAANIAPYGGKKAFVGNNPPSWAIPTRVVNPTHQMAPGAYQPVFLDMALSTVAGNRLDIYIRRGEEIPDDWLLDADGEPTTDPNLMRQGGSLTPTGGYKGSGMSIVMSMLTSFLGGGLFDDQRRDPVTNAVVPHTTGHWFQAYDVGQFVDLEAFTCAVRAAQDRIQASPPKAGVEQIFAPGDIENAKALQYQEEGIPLEQFTLDDLAWVAETVGVEYDIVR